MARITEMRGKEEGGEETLGKNGGKSCSNLFGQDTRREWGGANSRGVRGRKD